jgi:hypothetical protein
VRLLDRIFYEFSSDCMISGASLEIELIAETVEKENLPWRFTAARVECDLGHLTIYVKEAKHRCEFSPNFGFTSENFSFKMNCSFFGSNLFFNTFHFNELIDL